MSSTDLETSVVSTPIRSSAPQAMISFLCPLCRERLNVPADFAGVAASCPACTETIRAPREQAQPVVSRQMTVTSSLISLPSNGAGRGNRLPFSPLEAPAPMSDSYGSGFSAVKKIEALEPDDLDDSWREKVERDRKQTQRRKTRDRWLETAMSSATGEKYQKIGIAVLSAILVVTIVGVYLNHRSGGALFNRIFG